jgi:hypothetical protein
MGIVVPPHLYRPLKGKDHFQVWNYVPTKKEVDDLYKKAMKALKEGYPGTALKAGKDLWIYSEYFDTTYQLLNKRIRGAQSTTIMRYTTNSQRTPRGV